MRLRSLFLLGCVVLAGCSLTSQAKGLVKQIAKMKEAIDSADLLDQALRDEGEGPYETAAVEQPKSGERSCAEIFADLYELSAECKSELAKLGKDATCQHSTRGRPGNCPNCEAMITLRDREWAGSCSPSSVKK